MADKKTRKEDLANKASAVAEAAPVLEGKLKKSYQYARANACGGVEFQKTAWVGIPVGREDESKRTSYLDVRKIVKVNGQYSPKVIEKAAELDVDLADVKGSGAKGAVVIKDVVAHAKAVAKDED